MSGFEHLKRHRDERKSMDGHLWSQRIFIAVGILGAILLYIYHEEDNNDQLARLREQLDSIQSQVSKLEGQVDLLIQQAESR